MWPPTVPKADSVDLVKVHHWASAEALVCSAVLIGLGLRIYLPSYVPLGLVPVLATAPVWLLVLRRYRGALAFGSLAFIGVVFGLGLTVYAVGAREVTRQGLAKDLGLVLMMVTGVGVVLWGRQLLGRQATAVLVSLGMLAGAGLHLSNADGNVWKTGLGTPVILLLLSLTIRSARITLLFLAVLVAVSLVFDARSQAVILTVCFVLTAWQRRPAISSGRKVLGVAVPGLLLIGLAAYFLGTQALVRGYLGATAQQRSIQQINSSGSLLLGGRPEIAATLALMKSNLWGYGFGVAPQTADLLRAKEAMAAINYDPNNGYVERYMFGTGFELHSVVGDVLGTDGTARAPHSYRAGHRACRSTWSCCRQASCVGAPALLGDVDLVEFVVQPATDGRAPPDAGGRSGAPRAYAQPGVREPAAVRSTHWSVGPGSVGLPPGRHFPRSAPPPREGLATVSSCLAWGVSVSWPLRCVFD